MNTALVYQIILSFIIGGCFISFLSLLAEKTSTHLAGIIMMFPSTIVLGYFFLGITTSATKVAEIVPATLVPLGIVSFSSVIYSTAAVLYARIFADKMMQIVYALVTSSILWFCLAAPFAYWKINDLRIGIAGYALFTAVAYYLLHRKSIHKPHVRPVYKRYQVVLRAIFMGTIIAVVVVLGKELNPFWGGVFTMYPAVTFSTLMTFHYYYEPAQLFGFYKKAPVGSLSVLLYAISAMLLFPIVGLVWGTLAGCTICMFFTLLLISIQKKKLAHAHHTTDTR